MRTFLLVGVGGRVIEPMEMLIAGNEEAHDREVSLSERVERIKRVDSGEMCEEEDDMMQAAISFGLL